MIMETQPANQETVRPNPFPILLAILSVLFTSVTVGIWYYHPSAAWVNQDTLPQLILNDQPLNPSEFIWEEDALLLHLETVKENFDPHIHYEPQSQTVIVTTKDQVIEMNSEQLTTYINSEPVEITVPVTIREDKPFIPIEFLAPIYKVRVQRTSSEIGIIDSLEQPILIGKIEYSTYLRNNPEYRSPRISSMEHGEEVNIYHESNGWYYVRTSQGFLGYIDKSQVSISDIQFESFERKSYSPPWKPLGEKINLTWDYISRPMYDMSNYSSIPGLNVISPTWFHLADSQGKIVTHGSLPYVEWAHSEGLQVWALFSNSFDPERTSQVLRSRETRKKVINQLLVLSELYNLDGINIDFENMYYEDKDFFTQFLREMTPLLHEQGLTVSADVTLISSSRNWSMIYDREAMSEIVDYIAVMTYDEHWAASPVSGSVASLPWVERGIVRILEQIPNNKLLLGVPFYTRIWEEETQSDGSIQVSSRAYSMGRANEILKQNNADMTIDEKAGQNYGEYQLGGNTYRVWIEDDYSMRQRIELVRKYDLAGAASWRRGFEKPHIWDIIKEELTKRPYNSTATLGTKPTVAVFYFMIAC